MATPPKLGSLDFLSGEPAPVRPGDATRAQDPADSLPPKQVAALMALRGVDGVWIERDAGGQRVVVIHYTPLDQPTHLPLQVNGLPTRIVGGEPIRAY